MSGGKPTPLVVNGWTIFAHPLFLDQLEDLTRQVETLKQKDLAGYIKKNAAKRLAAIAKLAFEVIPQDPSRPEYRQGSTLGDAHKHWFRAKIFPAAAKPEELRERFESFLREQGPALIEQRRYQGPPAEAPVKKTGKAARRSG